MRGTLLVLLGAIFISGVQGQEGSASSGVVETDFTNPQASPSHWTLTLHKDGSGYFHSDGRKRPATESVELDVANVDRDVQVSADFADRVFRTAREHRWFNEECESHLKIAFQGWKKLSYSGPEGHGSCTFNYSKDTELQALGDQLLGVAETLLEGARLQALLQHDPLGLDKETEYVLEGSKDGRLQQVGTIKQILERLEDDPKVLDRVRKRARILLEQRER
ncbi:MAG: hypothetical protein WA802_11745 [Terracidiphilus sp.]